MDPTNSVEEVLPNVWLLRFPTVELVRAAHCTHLIPPLIEASKQGPIVLLAEPPADLKLVHGDMIPYWIEAFTKRGLAVRAIGVVTTRSAVRVVLNGLALALRLTGTDVKTMTKPTLAEVIDWAKAA